MSKLQGRVAIVTGASKGIGAAIAKQLAAEGAAVVVNYSSSKQNADQVVAEITGNGGRAIAVQANVAKPEEIGIDRIEARHRKMADYLREAMIQRGAESWTSPDPALRCAIATVNVPPIKRMELENWLWHTHKIRIRGGDPHKLRLSTPYYLLKKDVDRFLEKFDEYKKKMA